MLLAAATVEILYPIFLIFPRKVNRAVEPPKPNSFPTASDQREPSRKFQVKVQATAFDQDKY